MQDKFESEFKDRYAKELSILHDVRSLTEESERLLRVVRRHEDFLSTAFAFARISVESIDCVSTCLRRGHIGQSYVLLRHYLELSHLTHYLWSNREEYEKWLRGEEVRAREIGKHFEKQGFASWKETYGDWSNAVHGNSVFVQNYHEICQAFPISEGQNVLVGNALISMMYIAHKLNYVFGKALEPHLQSDYGEFALRYNQLEGGITECAAKHSRLEREFLDKLDHDSGHARP